MTTRLRDQLRRHPRAVTAVVAGGAVVLLAVAVGLAIAVLRAPQATGDASAVPSASASPSSSPTSDASPSSTPPKPSASPIPYAAGDPLMQVTVNGLRMRASPSTSADILRSLDRGEVVRLRGGGPVDADGYAWHEVVDLDSQIGWIALGSGVSGPWLEAVPAQPATSTLLLRYQRDCDVSPREMGGVPVWPPDLTLTADGRLVTWGGGGRLGTGTFRLVVRQLSPSGLARFQRDVLDLPALQASADYVLERISGSPEPPGHGVCVSGFTLGEGTARVEVTAVGWLGQEEGVYWIPSPERRALDELAAHLEEVEVWLGAAAWSEPIARPYVSSSYLLWLEPPNDPPPPSGVSAPSVIGAAWPFDGPIDQFGEPVGQARCGYLDLAQAFETLRLMRSLGVEATALGDAPGQVALDGQRYGNFTTEVGWFSFWLTPRSPDGYPGCAG